MKPKKKMCAGCESEQYIWKSHEGGKYCKLCWQKHLAGEGQLKPIAPKSKKQSKLDAIYTKLRRIFLTDNPNCQAALPGCMGGATDVHHTHAGADRSKYYLVVATWLGVCRKCHDWIHDNPKEAREQNLLK